MELFFIKDKLTGLYYVQNQEPFFYAFTDRILADQFCNSHPGTWIETQEIVTDEDDDYLITCIYQRGYKGGYIDGQFRSINQKKPELTKIIPENAGLLHLHLFRETQNKTLLTSQRYYFFAAVTKDGYLAFANTNGFIFAFSDIENIETPLAKALYKKGYEVVKYYLDEAHQYIVNPGRPTQTVLTSGLTYQQPTNPQQKAG